ncbi:MAG: hypothetical protein IJX24_07775 [Oscillospiraceae bacterium]|nr:hypothetical protein [Oscillospiraceae bacterium]
MKLSVREVTVFAMLGAVMYVSKVLMESLPNIHLLGVFTIAISLVYRKKALYAIYTYVFLNGLFGGFSVWWIPYLYIWTVLWGAVMLLPKNIPTRIKPVVYMTVCSLHGFLFGVLYAPAQMILFGLDFRQMLSWIAAGFPYDCIHGISNFFCGLLILPIVKALEKAEKSLKY